MESPSLDDLERALLNLRATKADSAGEALVGLVLVEQTRLLQAILRTLTELTPAEQRKSSMSSRDTVSGRRNTSYPS